LAFHSCISKDAGSQGFYEKKKKKKMMMMMTPLLLLARDADVVNNQRERARGSE
jgi:hypothetical protein